MPAKTAAAPESAAPVIAIRGARQNNLKNLDADIRTGELTVITGPSGSGKSSLAFDTLYAEGQRLYAETFSPYARQFLERCDRPKVDKIEGVPPAIAIDQSGTVRTSRSTVGTMTEINDHIKLLFAQKARLFCPCCGREVKDMSPAAVWDDIKAFTLAAPEARVYILFTVSVPKSFELEKAKAALNAQGFTHIEDEIKTKDGTDLSVAADRFKAGKITDARGREAVEKALAQGKGRNAGRLTVRVVTEAGTVERRYAAGLVCPDCDKTFHAPNPSLFSFNSPVGACPECRGFGRVMGLDLALAIPDHSRSINGGAVRLFSGTAGGECLKDLARSAKGHIRLDVPYSELTPAEKKWLLSGDPAHTEGDRRWYGLYGYWRWLESKSYKMHVRVLLSRYRNYTACPVCDGSRLKPEALWWRLGSRAAADAVLGKDKTGKGLYRRFTGNGLAGIAARIDKDLPGLTVHDLMLLPVARLKTFFDTIAADITDEAGALILGEIRRRLIYLMDVGLGYLTLDRQSRTLSGGEVQRVSLTTALGTNLTDTLFVLDEPSIGLHPRDMDRINAILENLKKAGNTLVVVEHDPQVMLAADRIIDMGPGAGSAGGTIVFDGTPQSIRASKTETGLYLSGKKSCDGFKHKAFDRKKDPKLTVVKAHGHNLKNITVEIPLNRITTVTGVSGAGKSTLVTDIIVSSLQRAFGTAATSAEPAVERIDGIENLKAVHFVDQSEIGRTTRSTPVLYMGAFEEIRRQFAATKLAADRNYDSSFFSFNYGMGRCPTCEGAGFERVEMQFLSDVLIKCPDCNGSRYRDETLEVTIAPAGKPAKNIAQVLDMTADEAIDYFAGSDKIVKKLKPLSDVGLGYLKLGQNVSTLSGGEAQRLKLASILIETTGFARSRALYVFDEPTTGLHFSDIAKLIPCLRRLIEAGHSVLIVEHNLDVIAASDWVIDLGPDGGDAGGEVVVCDTPEALEKKGVGYTARALAAYHKALKSRAGKMTGWFDDTAPLIESQKEVKGRSLQSVWREARQGDLGIFGAREHNLKNIDVVFPKKKLTAVTGVSGSGKSTLAFGIVFAEGQRRYLESLNAYARTMVQPAARAEADRIVGISPTVAIEQRTSRGGNKSTVATMTEIQHFLRLIYLKLGVQYCPDCHVPVKDQSFDAVVAAVMRRHKGKTVAVCAPVVSNRKGIYTELAADAAKAGVRWLLVDDAWKDTAHFRPLARYYDHSIDWPEGVVRITPENEKELRRLISAALARGKGTIRLFPDPEKTKSCSALGVYSTVRACPECGRSFPDPDPRLFSYNNRMGWCPTCLGSGVVSDKGGAAPEDATFAYAHEHKGDMADFMDSDENITAAEGTHVCPDCGGARLNAVARNVLFAGRSICETTALPVDESLAALKAVRLKGREKLIGEDALREIVSRLAFLKSVGLGYIALDRASPTLSGGEAQRIRLAAQLGSNLQGVCYVLDEPTIGLHSRDNKRLIESLVGLRQKGNTVLVVEHDEDTIRAAEHIVDIGPGAGSRGGELIFEGSFKDLLKNKKSVTAQMLRNPLKHTGVAQRKTTKETPAITVRGAFLHNLKDLTVRLPLGRLIVLSGVSGSGKSTLAHDVVGASLEAGLTNLKEVRRLTRAGKTRFPVFTPAGCKAVDGIEQIARVLEVDQTPIGKTPRSCPATYVEFFNRIRDIFANTNEAQERGFSATRFSFNTEEGRCPVCAGQGQIREEMNFLPDVTMTCEACKGMRFDEDTLSIKWHERSIGEILNMSVDDALEFFAAQPAVSHPLLLMQDVGLGYLRLGQPSNTLSGGEAQRIKLVTELAKAGRPGEQIRQRKTPHTFYILDEPTVGLHMADVAKLINVLQRLTAAGNTVLVVEHNLDVIAEADWVIDLGPEGGPEGGRIAAQGEPVDVAKADTPTGLALAEFLAQHKGSEKPENKPPKKAPAKPKAKRKPTEAS